MQTLRPAAQRGQAHFEGLHSQHSFSFGRYYDPAHMGYGPLRVINQDRVPPGGGFPAHGHQDMEIISLVLQGSMVHRDSLGNGSVIAAGDIQRMSAGTGIRHSEFNPSDTQPLEFLQIWIIPERKGLSPSYEQRSIADLPPGLTLVASRDARGGALSIHQDVDLYRGRLTAGKDLRHSLKPGRGAWLQMISGSAQVGGDVLQAGDGLAISHADDVRVGTMAGAEFLLFDMQMP